MLNNSNYDLITKKYDMQLIAFLFLINLEMVLTAVMCNGNEISRRHF